MTKKKLSKLHEHFLANLLADGYKNTSDNLYTKKWSNDIELQANVISEYKVVCSLKVSGKQRESTAEMTIKQITDAKEVNVDALEMAFNRLIDLD